MSAESRRHLTHRKTRFRSSTNNELGTVAEELDVTQYVYPNKGPADKKTAVNRTIAIEPSPAGFIGLGFTVLFLGLHQLIHTQATLQTRHRGGSVLLFLTICSAAAQLTTGVRERNCTRGGTFSFFFHGAHSLVWTSMALLQLVVVVPAAPGADEDALSKRHKATASCCRGLSVAASMLLMAAAFSCVGCAVVAARTARLRPLLASVGLGLLCFSRAEFQMAHDAAGAVDMNRYGGGFLIVSSCLAFRIASRAWERRCSSIRVTPGKES